MQGLVFSIEEFAVFDGDGIRANVFLKGCPLRCKWCHNPEGWSFKKQVVKRPNGCIGCGVCKQVCTGKGGECKLCNQCVYACPRHLLRVSGQDYEAKDLADRILKLKDILVSTGGGVTFSGGEVLSQADFLCEALDYLKDLNRAIETSGYANSEVFEKVLKRVDFVYYDLKIMDSERHRYYTGVPNEIILKNAEILMNSGVPYVFRVPFIKDVNTDRENLEMMAKFLSKAPTKPKVEFLLYNTMAGSKYKMLGLEYAYDFEQPTAEQISLAKEILCDYDVSIRN